MEIEKTLEDILCKIDTVIAKLSEDNRKLAEDNDMLRGMLVELYKFLKDKHER